MRKIVVLQIITATSLAGAECDVKTAIRKFDASLNQACIKLVDSYKLPSVRAEKLWGLFHIFFARRTENLQRL